MPTYHSASGSVAEDLFIELFSETFGAEKTGYLYSQYHFYDIYQNSRYADFVLQNGAHRVAIEIDDETSHNKSLVASNKFYDDLLKQNSMVHLGWDVYRWAVRQMQIQPEAVKDELRVFMGILEDFYNQQEKIEGISAKTALKITNNSISILQDGLNTTSASETADIILQEAETFDFVAITSLDEILGFSSYRTEAPFVSFLVDDFQNLFKTSFKQDAKNLDVIRSYINVPIYNDKHHVGYFCVGHILDSETTPFETTLAHGLGTMITNQITVHSIKEKAGLYDKAEIKALQSQINPHFLFNALSTISFHCSQQPQTAKSLINDLASYYRNNLTDGNTMISILNELQHINAYIHLEQARFGDRLKVDYDINIEESFLVPALILQPIVENAIRHGLYQKLEGGRIIIRIDKQKNSFRIAVIDDGLGMTSDRLKHIFDNTKPKNSIGLTNVNQRLITLYGPKNKLKIYSSMNNGTIVIMKIPFQEVSENND